MNRRAMMLGLAAAPLAAKLPPAPAAAPIVRVWDLASAESTVMELSIVRYSWGDYERKVLDHYTVHRNVYPEIPAD